jgi:hypothetical protein
MGPKNFSQNRNMKASSVKGEGDVDCEFFLAYGVVLHYEFSPRVHNVNKQYYLEMMKCLREAVKGKRANSRTKKKWMLHNNNALAYFFSLELLATCS